LYCNIFANQYIVLQYSRTTIYCIVNNILQYIVNTIYFCATLVSIEALNGASTFGDGDLNTKNTKMSVHLPGSMFLLLLWITTLSN
jgi:hypothetical protein